MKYAKTETVKVAVRVRPINALEIKNNSVNCVEVDRQNNQINLIKTENNQVNTFQYDYVYPPNISQRVVYDETAFPIVEAVIEGYNGTIFAYGQTGCGKTFTMMGDFASLEFRGIIPNAFEHIFGYINSEENKKKFLVRCSFLEIYNEEIRDLLGKDTTKKLDIREDPKTGIFVKDLNIIQMKTTKDLENELNKGFNNRHVGETTMNKESSRSHCIFTVYIESSEITADSKNQKIKAGKLNLVDLAGSERQSKTGVMGERLEEAKKINLSLTALSNVIKALADGKSHVPYRDSKLTRLLQDSLGGNTKTLMIAAISPSSYNYDETFGTLRYASRANSIKNTPKVNEDPKDALLRQYEEQIRLLKEQLVIVNNGNIVLKEINLNSVTHNGSSDSDEEGNKSKKMLEHEKNLLYSEKQKIENNLKEKEILIMNNNLEKEKLFQRILELEKDMNKKIVHIFFLNENFQIDGGEYMDENKKKKFKEYREKAIKKEEELQKKHDLLDEKKKNEDELLNFDKKYANSQTELEEKNKIISKLKNKIKLLESEIRDLKYENEIEKEENNFALKEYYKDYKLYQGIVKFIISDQEIKKITESSQWKGDIEEWRIQPFHFREKTLKLPNIKPHQINEFIDNEVNNRELILDEFKSTQKNKFQQKEYMYNGNNPVNYKEINNHHKNARFDDNCPPDLFTHPQINNRNQIYSKNIILDPLKKPTNQNININAYVINKKEAKKYEDLLKYNSNMNDLQINVNLNNQNISNQIPPGIKPVKNGKVILDPINNYNNMNEQNQTKKNFYPSKNKKMEVSFKATLKFTDDIGNNNKIEFSPNINVQN